jgi:hypothetical protein
MAVYVPLPGSRRELLHESRAAGPIDPSEEASITVRVRPAQDPKALEKLAYELARTPLAERKYLTHQELEAQYGAQEKRPRSDRALCAATQSDRHPSQRGGARRRPERTAWRKSMRPWRNSECARVFDVGLEQSVHPLGLVGWKQGQYIRTDPEHARASATAADAAVRRNPGQQWAVWRVSIGGEMRGR